MELKSQQIQKKQPRPAHKQTRNILAKSWMPWAMAGGMLALGVTMLLAVAGFVVILSLSQNRIPTGVSVAGLPIGGESEDKAAAALQQLANKSISLTDLDRKWPVSLADLGVKVDIDATVKAAGNASPNAAIPPIYTIDLKRTQDTLIAMSDQINIPAASGQKGRALDIPFVLDRLRIDVTGELADGIFDLNMIEVELPETEAVNQYTGATTTHVVEKGQELGLIAKLYGVDMNDIIRLNNISNPDLLYVGQELTIPATGIYTPSEADSPAAPTNVGKSVVVSTQNQRIYAYENGKLVRSDLVSTGLPATPTVLGDYKIYVKYVADDMSGPDYFLPQVPYTMYFYSGYAIHGTYWHNAFGRPMSHGCVNLPVGEAEWFFNWAEVGTPVRVI